MVQITLFDFDTYKPVKVIARSASFAPSENSMIIFINLCYCEQSFLDWLMKTEGTRLMTWFGSKTMRVWIPTKMIDSIESYYGEIPMYVPNPDLD